MVRVKAVMCSDECRREWELKYARMILGKSAGMKEEDPLYDPR
jgi:hypothetical protein